MCDEELTTRNTVIAKIIRSIPFRFEDDLNLKSMKLQKKVSTCTEVEDWETLGTLTAEMRGKLITTMAGLKGMGELSSQMPASCLQVSEQNNAQEFLKTKLRDPAFRAEVEKILAEHGKPVSLIDKLINSEKKSSGFLEKTLDESLLERAKYAVAIGYTGYWGGFLAAFNQQIAKSKPLSFTDKEINEISIIIEEQKESIENGLLQLYTTIASGSEDEIYQKGTNILLEQEEKLAWLARFAAIICVSAQEALKGNNHNATKAISFIDLEMGIVARLWALLSTAALYTIHIGILPKDHTELLKAIKSARTLPFESKVPDGKNVIISDLAKKGSEYHDKFVEVFGFVRDLQVVRTRDGKLLTIFSLFTPGKDESIKVAAIFEHLAHRGMINSSTVRINGIWKEKSNIADEPVLQIDRIELSKLKKQSWMDYLVVAIRPWFDFYPNSHNLNWSIRPERKGDEGNTSTLTGAGEIEFIRPFMYKKKEEN